MVTPPDSSRWWRNRRRMAWSAVLSGLLFPLLVLVADSKTLADIAGPFYIFAGMIVAAYIGAATYDDDRARNA